MTITLTPELERALSERAKEQGTTPEMLAVDVLRSQFLPSGEAPQSDPAVKQPDPSMKSMADFLRDHIGVLHSGEIIPGGARMSEDCGKKFADGLVEKHRRGRT